MSDPERRSAYLFARCRCGAVSMDIVLWPTAAAAAAAIMQHTDVWLINYYLFIN